MNDVTHTQVDAGAFGYGWRVADWSGRGKQACKVAYRKYEEVSR